MPYYYDLDLQLAIILCYFIYLTLLFFTFRKKKKTTLEKCFKIHTYKNIMYVCRCVIIVFVIKTIQTNKRLRFFKAKINSKQKIL